MCVKWHTMIIISSEVILSITHDSDETRTLLAVGRGDKTAEEAPAISSALSEAGNRCSAGAVQGSEEGALRSHSDAGLLVVQRGQVLELERQIKLRN